MVFKVPFSTVAAGDTFANMMDLYRVPSAGGNRTVFRSRVSFELRNGRCLAPAERKAIQEGREAIQEGREAMLAEIEVKGKAMLAEFKAKINVLADERAALAVEKEAIKSHDTSDTDITGDRRNSTTK